MFTIGSFCKEYDDESLAIFHAKSISLREGRSQTIYKDGEFHRLVRY